MDVHFKKTDERVSGAIIDQSRRKITRLTKYLGYGAASAQAYVEISYATGGHRSGPFWQTFINVDASGKRFNAAAEADSPAKSTYKAINELASELRRMHQKNTKAVKRGGWRALFGQSA